MKTKYLLLFLFTSMLGSCRFGTNIILENRSNTDIDSLFIHTDFNKIKLNKIEKNKSHSLFVNFNNSKHKGDGIFVLQIFENGKVKKTQQFGYFSNGIPPSHDFIIKIYNDTIQIESVFD